MRASIYFLFIFLDLVCFTSEVRVFLNAGPENLFCALTVSLSCCCFSPSLFLCRYLPNDTDDYLCRAAALGHHPAIPGSTISWEDRAWAKIPWREERGAVGKCWDSSPVFTDQTPCCWAGSREKSLYLWVHLALCAKAFFFAKTTLGLSNSLLGFLSSQQVGRSISPVLSLFPRFSLILSLYKGIDCFCFSI